MAARNETLSNEMDRLYELYGKPYEAEHRGEFLAIAPDGRTLLAETPGEALREAVRRFGSGNFIFKVGEGAIGRVR